MPATTKKKRGRPRKPDSEKRRNNVTIRMRDSLKRELEESAATEGRSLSEEIEFSLELLRREREAFGGRQLHGLMKLLVGSAEIIQERNGESPFSDWDTWNAVHAAWKRLIMEMAPKPPADFVQHVEQGHELPRPPERPIRPPSPGPSGLLKYFEKPDLEKAKAYAAKVAAFDKEDREYDKRYARYLRKVEAHRRETQQWADRVTSYSDLGRSVAAELFPSREAVSQTAIPTQRVDKSKEK